MVTSMSQTEKGHQSCPLPRVTKRGGRASARQFQGHWPPSPMSCCVTLGGGRCTCLPSSLVYTRARCPAPGALGAWLQTARVDERSGA